MMEENYFKDAQIVSVPANHVAPDLVYIDDDEEETRTAGLTTIKIELTDEEPRRSSTPFNGESDNENPMNIKVTPMEVDEDDTPKVDSVVCKYSEEKIYMPNIKSEVPDDDIMIEEQEQFEIVGNAERDSSSSSNDSTRVNKSNESNDHSYSQPPQSNNSLSEDIIKTMLLESNLSNNQNVYKLLKEYTKFFEKFIFAEEQNSQLSIYLNQVMTSLENHEKNLATITETKNVENTVNSIKIENFENFDTNINENSEEQVPTLKKTICNVIEGGEENMNINSEEKMDCPVTTYSSDILEVKSEAIESDTGILNEKKEENIIQPQINIEEEAEKLKVYVKTAQDKTAEFSEKNQKLLESVFVTDEDVENGNSKFKSSLYNFISFNVALLMDIENNTNFTSVDDKINMIKDEISNARRRASGDEKLPHSRKSSENREKKITSRKSSISSLDKDSSDSDTDNSINRLTNLKTLDQKSKKYEKSPNNLQDSQLKKTQKLKKKRKNSEDEHSLDSDTSESESNEMTKKDEGEMNEGATSDDEEVKLKTKLELRARDNLLASSDDDESEESFVTSETSEFSSDDERNDSKIKKRKKIYVKQSESVELTENEEEPKESLSDVINSNECDGAPKPTNSENAVKEEDDKTFKNNQTSENNDVKKAKKRQRTSFEREVFNKSLLDDSNDENISDDEELSSPKNAKKTRKVSITTSLTENKEASNGNTVNPAQQVINIKADRKAPTLEKYIEKLASNNVELNLTNLEEPSTSSTKASDSSPKKSDQKPKPPSPMIDDIDCISISSESDSEISSVVSEGTTRRRKQLTEEELKEETKKAKKDEAERVKKLEAKEQRISQYITQKLSQSDVIAADELVLDYSEEKNLVVVVDMQLVGKLKEHQVDGIKFMYNNCYGSVDEVKENNGSGCILAHCMGLGKTLQLIVLLHTVIRYPELHTKRVLIICPKSTIHNWAEEFRKWLVNVENKPVVFYLEDHLKIEKRIDKLREWYECRKPSVFLINYESFRTLAHWSGSHKRSKILLPEETIKKYKQQISKYLLDPGPNLIVCDEGHIIKNQKGATNRAITKIKTRRRIILTGTPVQNSLHEYYAMVEWIKPNILGTIHEFNNIYANPIKDGQNKDSTDHQIKKMKQKSYVLNKNLSKFVQRKDAQVLKEFLPKKYEYCISVPLTYVQEKLYNNFLQANRSGEMGRNLLPIYTGLRKIWTHPTVLQYAYERARRGENKFGHQDNQQKEKKSKDAFNEDEEEPDDVFDTSQGTTAVTNNWWNKMVTEDDMKSLTSSHKMLLLFEILRLCELKREKILIFSSFVAVLDIIERFMKAIHNQENNPKAKLYGLDKYKATWELGKDYFRLDGSTPRIVRSEMINAFNNSKTDRLRCFLISAKAGGQGINLVAANRCIIVDTSWNPANDNQNIFRIFRLGQKKTCYVYRLVACCTMEERVYSRSVTKEAMSHRVVEKKQIDRHYVRTELEELFVPYELKPQEKTPNFPDDDILRYLLHALPKSAYNFHEHDSLLENKPEQELNEDEKNEAWNSYLAELQGNRHQLQNMNNTNMNLNMPNLGTFGKSPISSDFMKLYQDMIGSTPNYASLAGMMSSTSSTLAGLDPLGLSSSYFPLTSNFYTTDFLKRFGNYDPLTSLYTTTSLPNSPNVHSTSTSSPLMQSVLRNSQNPISALGNMTGAASTSSYNANNIPPASSSIFAQPSTTNTTSSVVPYTASTSPLVKVAPKKNVARQGGTDLVSSLLKNSKTTQLNPVKHVNRPLTTKGPIITPPNSSENLAILPDDEHISKAPSPTILSKSFAGTSARTHQVLPKNDRSLIVNKEGIKTNVIDSNLRSRIRPNILLNQSNGSKSLANSSNSIPQSPVMNKSQNTVIHKTQSLVNSSVPQIGNGNTSIELRKMNAGQYVLSQNKTSVTPITQQQNFVRPLLKTTSRPLTKAPVALNLTQNKPRQIINVASSTPLSTNDSISIIRLPKQKDPTINKTPFSAPSTPTPSKLSAIKVPQNVTKILQKQQKKIIDNQTNQTLKRIRINDSQSPSQNTQQSNPLRIVSQQIISPQPNVSRSPILTHRAMTQPQQIIQNPIRRKSSQPTNKTISTVPYEVVEVDD